MDREDVTRTRHSTQPGPADAPPRQLGRFTVVNELGRGGMGVVLRAVDPALQREVALKLLDPSVADAEQLARFALEARTGAALRHPGIVAVYEAGAVEGRPYLVMELVRGRSFEAQLRARRVAPRRVAEVVRDVALALQHAHEHGIVHRDVKPENVFVDDDGHVRLGDFGIARQQQAQRMTATGAILGTPAYMAPEQVEGLSKHQDARTDVYALGGVLYRALAGEPPFRAPTVQALFRAVLFEEAPPLRARARAVPADLETIALRCLEKEPARRYPTARAVAEELQRWLDGEPIEARPAGALARAGRWARRNRRPGALLACLLAALGLTGVLAWRLSVAAEARRVAEAAARAAAEREAAERRAERGRAWREALLQEADPAALLQRAERALALPAAEVARELQETGLMSAAREALLRERRLAATLRLLEAAGVEDTDPAAYRALAERALADATALEPLDPGARARWRFVGAMASLELGRRAEWEAGLRRCRDEDPDGAFGVAAATLLRYAAGGVAPDDLADELKRALALAPRRPEVVLPAARLLLQLDRHGDARAALRELESPEVLPRCAAAGPMVRVIDLLLAAQQRTRLNDLPGALKRLDEARAVVPTWRPVLRELTRVQLDLQRFEDVLATCELARRAGFLDEEPDLLLRRATALVYLRRQREALADCERVIRLAPDRSHGYFVLARAQAELGLVQEALASMDRAIALEDTGDYRLRRARILEAVGRLPEALADCERAVALSAPGSTTDQQAALLADTLRRRLGGR